MSLLLAIEAELELTVLTLASVLLFVVVGDRSAPWQWAPAHVLHLRDGLVQAELFPLLHLFGVQVQVSDVVVVQHCLAVFLGALYKLNLPVAEP